MKNNLAGHCCPLVAAKVRKKYRFTIEMERWWPDAKKMAIFASD
ncbi:MAG: hypothetical protein ACI30N_08795 [Muribaculaceae bacterium]